MLDSLVIGVGLENKAYNYIFILKRKNKFYIKCCPFFSFINIEEMLLRIKLFIQTQGW